MCSARGRKGVSRLNCGRHALVLERLENRLLLSAGSIERVSMDPDGVEGNDHSDEPSISADGRYVAFHSVATNLVAGDTNGVQDVFVYDRETDSVECVSVAADGTEGNDESWYPSISADGRYVAFRSSATNLVAGDTNNRSDVFVYDRDTDSIERVSVASDGTQGNDYSYEPSLSADGRYVAFYSYTSNLVVGDTNGWSDIFVFDRDTDTVERVSVADDGTEANAPSALPSISADGRYVAFYSDASNLVAGDTNGYADVFVYDRDTGDIERISVADDGTEGDDDSYDPYISADGRYVAFHAYASNLVAGDTNSAQDVFVYDRDADSVERVSVAGDGTEGDERSYTASISADGRYVAFLSFASNLVAGDTNGVRDIFVYDRTADSIERVSVADDGTEGNAHSLGTSISADGRYTAFFSWAWNLVPDDTNDVRDVFVCDRDAGTIERVSMSTASMQGDGGSYDPSISADGRYVAFKSSASNLVAGDTNGVQDVFVYDRGTDSIERVSVANDGTEGNGNSLDPFISADGRYVVFHSIASNLVAGDTNGTYDVFVYDRDTDSIERASVAGDGTEGNDPSYHGSVTADGRYVAFYSRASNLVEGDTNGTYDVFVYDRDTDSVERVSVADDGTEGNDQSYSPFISEDGRYVAFESGASNLIAGDTNAKQDIFVYDRDTDSVERISVTGGGAEANDDSYYPSLSAGGRYVAFDSCASNLVPGDTNGAYDVFVYDRATDSVERVSVASDATEGNDASYDAAISADGRYVAFESGASNLLAGDGNDAQDIFVYDRDNDTVERVSVAGDGAEGNFASYYAAISADGRYVAFESGASNLVPGDTNGSSDVFVYDRGAELGAISGAKYEDVDGDGAWDVGEPGLSGWTIFLDADDDGVLDVGETSTTTVADGSYSFADLVAGDYIVAEVQQAGWGQTFPAGGSHSIVLASGESRADLDFGNRLLPPGVPDLQPKSDTGRYSSDDLTARDNSDSLRRMEFVVAETVPGATVTLYADGVAFGTALATDSSTTVTTNGTYDLADGAHSITARQTVPGEEESPDSAALIVTVDTTLPSISAASITSFFSVDSNEVGVAEAGDVIRVEWDSAEPSASIWTVWLDMTEFGHAGTAMYDNGTNGDSTPHDGVWTAEFTVPLDGIYYEPGSPNVRATDMAGLMTDADDDWTVQVNNTGLVQVDAWAGDGILVSAFRRSDSPDIDSANIAVKFGKKRDARIKLGGAQTMEGLCLVVSGATSVSLSDGRSGAPGVLAFFASDGPVKALRLKSGLNGYNLNNATLGGVDFSENIDGDEEIEDLTAVYVEGYLSKVVSVGGIDGDLWVGAADSKGYATKSMQIKNGGFHGDMVLSGDVGKVQFGGDFGSSLQVAGALKMLDIKNGNAAGTISVTGDLGKVSVKGGDFTADLEIGGGLQVLQVNSMKDKATKQLVGGNMLDADITVAGDLKIVKVGWDLTDGHLQAGSLAKILVKNQITAVEDDRYIHAENGSFLVKDADDKLLIEDSAGEWLDGLHACVV